MDPAPLVLAGTFAPELSARLKDLGGGVGDEAEGGVTAAFSLRSPAARPRAEANAAAPPGADSAAGETGTAGAGRTGSA